MSLPTRADAWALLNEYTSSDSLIKHMLAVEAAMRAYARLGRHDEDLWGVTGLLHDFDYERWPNPALDQTGHPWTGVAILREHGYPDEVCDSILGHAPFTNHPRTSPLAKTLFAVDEICGLIVAMAYVRPDRLSGLEPSSVNKKLKDKAFARGVNRDDVRQGIEELGVDPTDHYRTVIEALQSAAPELGLA
jgi:putative nucleotidyltransferase with HDIG domain